MLRITRQTQSVSLLRQGSAGPRERPADGAAEIIRSKVQILHIPVREVRGDRRGRHLSREKDSKTLVLAAFFPPFLLPQKEREPSET